MLVTLGVYDSQFDYINVEDYKIFKKTPSLLNVTQVSLFCDIFLTNTISTADVVVKCLVEL